MITRATLSTIEQGLPKYRSMLAGNAAYIPSGWFSIATTTASGGESSITMSSIPSQYSVLIVRINAQVEAGFQNNNGISIRFNGDTGGNYARQHLTASSSSTSANGTSGASSMPVPGDVFPSNTRANYFGVAQIIIPDYADTTKTKSLVFHAGMNVNIDTMRYARKGGGLWTGTAAISSITFLPQYTFAAGSTFSLYGAI